MSAPSGRAINVAEVGELIFATVVAHFEADQHELRQPLPERRYMAPGDTAAVAWDCEQFTVAIIGVGTGVAPESGAQSAKPGTGSGITGTRHAIYSVTLVRCTPVLDEDGTPPTMAALHEAGRHYLHDVGMVSQALVEAGSKLRVVDRSAVITAGAVQPIGPSGGFVGLEGQLTVTTAHLV